MADSRISDLSQLLTYTLTDQHEVLHSGSNVRIPISALAQLVGYPYQGRLTTESGVPVSTSDRTLQATIYFTPYNGNLLALYTASNWKLYTFTERSLALSGLTSGKNYDVFLYDNSGTITIELSAAWTNDTTRADAIAQQDGIDVKSSDHSRRLIGTIRTTGTTTTEDSAAKRFVWNEYNQTKRSLLRKETTNSWTYTTFTWRQANGSGSNQVEYVCGNVSTAISVTLIAFSKNTGANNRYVGIGIDSTSVPTGLLGVTGTNNTDDEHNTSYDGLPGLGYHKIVWLEESAASGTTTFYGIGGGGDLQTGLTGSLWN